MLSNVPPSVPTKPLTRVTVVTASSLRLDKLWVGKLFPWPLLPAGSETPQSHSGAGQLPKDASFTSASSVPRTTSGSL